MRFRVTNQYSKGPEDILAEFKNQQDAESFITNKAGYDNAMKVKVIYRLYDTFELVKEYDSAEVQESSSASSGSGKSSGFRPSPLSTTPTPPGLPKKWWNDDEEEKK